MNYKLSSNCRTSSRNLHSKTASSMMTSQAGLIPIFQFLSTLGFRRKCEQMFKVYKHHNATYNAHEILELLVMGICGGARSIEKVIGVWNDEVLRIVTGWAKIPHSTVISSTLKRSNLGNVNEMETLVHKIRKAAWKKMKFNHKEIVIDVDSTVKTTYGFQEGTAKGYNPVKRGARSYNPQLAFCVESKEILQGWLRSGDTYTSNGTVGFLKQLVAQLDSIDFLLRADSGYFDEKILEWIESQKQKYLIKVKLRNLTSILELQEWTSIEGKSGWEEARFQYKCKSWKKERSFVAIRRKSAKQQTNQLIEFTKYDYFCYVTTENESTWQIHKKYGERATCETWIEEAKNQMALGQIKTNDFNANSILLQCSIIAYNVIRWMEYTSANKQLKKWEPETVRTFLIRVAGKLTTGGRILTITYAKNHLYQEVWDEWKKLGKCG